MLATEGESQKEAASSSRFTNRTCWKCGGPHLKRDCPSLSDEERKAISDTAFKGPCYRCGTEGHSSTRCPKKEKMFCKVCKKTSHTTEAHRARPKNKPAQDELKVMLTSTLSSLAQLIKEKKAEPIVLQDFQD